jgi:hypothetical protein
LDRNQLAELRIVSQMLNLGTRTPVRPISLFERIRATLKSAGITNLSALGQVRLSGPQSWVGGQLVRGDQPSVVIRDRLPIPRMPNVPAVVAAGGLGTRRMRALGAPTQPSPLISIEEFWVAADEIVLAAGLDAVIRVPGAAMLIANRIVVEPGAKIRWEPDWTKLGINYANYDNPGKGSNGGVGAPGTGQTYSSSAPPASKEGGKGGNGAQGPHGIDGPDAPSLVLLTAEMDRLPTIDLTGYRGGKGGTGGNGGKGGPGARGEPALCGRDGIRDRGRGWGGRGGRGGDAGRGGAGGKGGDGASVELFCPQEVKDAVTALIDVRLVPGAGGDGGPAGNPGPGGAGGRQGSDSCFGWGPDGRNGPDGIAGRADITPPAELRGEDGDLYGVLSISVLSKEDISLKFNMPAITRLEPPNALPGANVIVHGANIPPNVRVRLGGSAAPIAFARADTTRGTFVLPGNVVSGYLSVEFVDAAGAVVSNIATLSVLPRLDNISGAGRWGATLQLRGAGFGAGTRVRVGTLLLDAVIVDTANLRVTLPMPGGAFEQQAVDIPLCVVDAGGRESASHNLRMEHWLHLGMDAVRDGFSFSNTAAELGTVPDSIIDLDLFEETFGEDDMDTLAPDDLGAIAGAVVDPAATGAGWLFFLAYKEFLKSRPGVCCAWSAFALDHYLSGGAALRDQYTSLSQLGRELFALQGRVLSLENIGMGLAQAALGDRSNQSFLEALESVLRDIVAGRGDTVASRYPLLAFIAKPTMDLAAYWGKISDQHIILPYAIRYPDPGESFYARVYCIGNWAQRHNRVDFTLGGGGMSFHAREFSGAAGQDPHDASAGYRDLSAYRTSQDWIVGSIPMSLAMYDDVDIPTEVLKILSPVTVQIDAGSNRRIGFTKGDLWAHTDHVAPVPWVPGLFVLKGATKLSVTVEGRRTGTYGVGMMNYRTGRGALVLDAKTRSKQRDSLEIGTDIPSVRLTPGGDAGKVRLGTVQRGASGTRRAVLTNQPAARGRPVGLASPPVGGIQVEGTRAGSTRLRLGFETPTGIRVTRAGAPSTSTSRRAGRLADPWAELEAQALGRERAGGTLGRQARTSRKFGAKPAKTRRKK